MNADMPPQTASPSAGNEGRRKNRHKWWEWLLLAIPFAWGLTYCGAFSPILSPLVYTHLVPSGWRNITPHGKLVLQEYAVSTDMPGLIMACGTAFSITVNDPATWIPGRLHFWLSHDGGASWSLVSMPKSDGSDCGIAMPTGEPGTIIASAFSTTGPLYQMTDATTWVSHDTGTSWRAVPTSTTNGGNPISLFGTDYTMGAGIYFRHGVLYGSGLEDYVNGTELVFSVDGGATWAYTLATPDALEQQGWQISSNPVPDYREDQWWYRTLSKQGQPPMLEHSTDDGSTWTAIGAIGNEPIQSVLLNTSPEAPDHLCMAASSANTSHLSIFASADSGRTWQTGVMPTSLADATGETSLRLEIGADGACFQGFHYHRPQAPSDENDYAFLRLAPQESAMQVIPLGPGQNVISDNTTYVPAGNGMQPRLVTSPALITSGWSALSDLATETDQGQLLWTVVP